MSQNPLLNLQEFGQSIWLDDLDRRLLSSGELARLIREDGLRGVTSNPSIFNKAITGSEAYDTDIKRLASQDKSAEEIYQILTVGDVRGAADVLRGVYEESGGAYGFVSLEVNPHLAYRTQATIAEARELWAAVDRPNLFIKVPATQPGLPAIRTLIGEGINVNVTLLFGLPRYREVADAYIAGLEQRAAAGGALDRVRSVASFFLSRIDVLVDPELEKAARAGGPEAGIAETLRGRVAIASAKLAYQIYKQKFREERFRVLSGQGARSQPVLWASTSTKNPEYSDVKYVEALIGAETINTAPRETLDAFRDHGRPTASLEEHLDEARTAMDLLLRAGIDIDRVTRQLEEEGVEKFNKPYDRLLEAIAGKMSRA